MSEGKHTPTPWRLRTEGNLGSAIEAPSGKRYSELDDGYRIVCSYQECCASDQYLVQEQNRLANGEFIVRAVNNHDALVKALSELERDCLASDFNEHWESFKAARAALAAARGEA